MQTYQIRKPMQKFEITKPRGSPLSGILPSSGGILAVHASCRGKPQASVISRIAIKYLNFVTGLDETIIAAPPLFHLLNFPQAPFGSSSTSAGSSRPRHTGVGGIRGIGSERTGGSSGDYFLINRD
jgi:hypothetical protein